MKKIIIAIDWLSGTGKWTTSRWVAKELWYIYVDTWAMRRAAALYALRHKKMDDSDEEKARMLKEDIIFWFEYNEKTGIDEILLNGENVESEIRSPDLWKQMSPIVTSFPTRRQMMLKIQALGKNGWIVADGRDMWTVVFPDAQVKVFLTCSLEKRVSRRREQLRQQWTEISEEDLRKQLIFRDQRDFTWPDAVNKKAEDAYEIDTSDLTIQEQINIVVRKAKDFL